MSQGANTNPKSRLSSDPTTSNVLLYKLARAEKRIKEITDRLMLLEGMTEPRLRSILTLRPLRFALRQWFEIKSGKAPNHVDRLSRLTSLENLYDLDAPKSDFQPTSAPQSMDWGQLGIAVFLHTRENLAINMLESLARQDALHITHIFIDGDQGKPELQAKIDRILEIVGKYPVKAVHRQRGAFGFRKMMLIAGKYMAEHYERIVFLEDDCFPVNGAIAEFQRELSLIEDNASVFSVYGHPFLTPDEEGVSGRFQSWGWATTRSKLLGIWDALQSCYLMSEPEYLAFVEAQLSPDVQRRIDITPGRQPSSTLKKFFAWDETVCLLTAAANQGHKRSETRLIYNCGAGVDASHFKSLEMFRSPPFNMIDPQEVWGIFDQDR